MPVTAYIGAEKVTEEDLMKDFFYKALHHRNKIQINISVVILKYFVNSSLSTVNLVIYYELLVSLVHI